MTQNEIIAGIEKITIVNLLVEIVVGTLEFSTLCSKTVPTIDCADMYFTNTTASYQMNRSIADICIFIRGWQRPTMSRLLCKKQRKEKTMFGFENTPKLIHA